MLLSFEDLAFDTPAPHSPTRSGAGPPLSVLHAAHDSHRDRYSGRNAAEDALVEQLVPWRSRYPQVPLEMRVVHGVPADELLRAAATAHLIVVGTHRRGHRPTCYSAPPQPSTNQDDHPLQQMSKRGIPSRRPANVC